MTAIFHSQLTPVIAAANVGNTTEAAERAGLVATQILGFALCDTSCGSRRSSPSDARRRSAGSHRLFSPTSPDRLGETVHPTSAYPDADPWAAARRCPSGAGHVFVS